MGVDEMKTVGQLIGKALSNRDDEATLTKVRDEVRALCAAFPPYPGLART
jgi:glycine/serine hydroxymethyltransferase